MQHDLSMIDLDMKTPPTMSFIGSMKIASLLYAGIITVAMFIAIPITQIATDGTRFENHLTVSTYKAPPPPPPIDHIEKIEDKKVKEEDLKMKKDFQKLSLATIDMALNVGSGGGAGASIYVPSFTIDDSDLNFDFAFEISELDKAPIPLVQIAPMYPEALKRAGVAGKVMAEFIVTKNGRVVKTKINESTNFEFERPVLEALRRWQFQPGVKDDMNVNTRVRIPFYFNLDSA